MTSTTVATDSHVSTIQVLVDGAWVPAIVRLRGGTADHPLTTVSLRGAGGLTIDVVLRAGRSDCAGARSASRSC